MSLLGWVKAALTGSRVVSLTDPMTWSGAGTADTGEMVTEHSALGLSATWACVNLLAGTVATLPVNVFRRVGQDGEREALHDHPLARLLNASPNYDQTAVDLWEFAQTSLELWGNCYALKSMTGSKIVGLLPINPSRMSVKRLKTGTIEYRWTDDDGEHHVKPDTDVLHIRGFGGNPLGGMSTLRFGRNAFGLSRSIDREAANMFRNGVRPSGVLTFEKWLTDEQRAIAREDLTSQYIGAANSGKPIILEGGTSWTPLSINPEDAQMLESRQFGIEEICRFFGVPPHMIGHTQNSTSWGSGLEQQTLGFQKFTLRRRLKRIEQALNKQCLTDAERAKGLYVEFNLEGLLRGDSAARATFYKSGLSDGWLTINEVRRMENKPPVPGGDVPRMQMQNVPITDASPPPNSGEITR